VKQKQVISLRARIAVPARVLIASNSYEEVPAKAVHETEVVTLDWRPISRTRAVV
jgi:hypothetical protein